MERTTGYTMLLHLPDGYKPAQVAPAQAAKIQTLPAALRGVPEISPSPDFGANVDKRFTERSSGLQAWGTYGVLWPVVPYELGVAPDLGNGALSIVPQVPTGQPSAAGKNITLGRGSVDVSATSGSTRPETTVTRHLSTHLTRRSSADRRHPGDRHLERCTDHLPDCCDGPRQRGPRRRRNGYRRRADLVVTLA